MWGWWWLFSKPSFPFLISPSWFWTGKIRHADLALNFGWEAVDIVIHLQSCVPVKNSWLDISLYNRIRNILLWSRYIYGQRYQIMSYTYRHLFCSLAWYGDQITKCAKVHRGCPLLPTLSIILNSRQHYYTIFCCNFYFGKVDLIFTDLITVLFKLLNCWQNSQ